MKPVTVDRAGSERRAPSVPPRLSRGTLEAVTRREEEALAELFEVYFDRLYGLAYRLVGDHATAEDVTQEVFLKVHRAAHQLDPGRDPGPWLAKITTNACREHQRRRGRRKEDQASSIDDPAVCGAMIDNRPDPAATAVQRELGAEVQAALLRLDEGQRSVVVLHDLHGLSHNEIAAVVDASPAAVRKRYSRALELLRGYLKGVLR